MQNTFGLQSQPLKFAPRTMGLRAATSRIREKKVRRKLLRMMNLTTRRKKDWRDLRNGGVQF